MSMMLSLSFKDISKVSPDSKGSAIDFNPLQRIFKFSKVCSIPVLLFLLDFLEEAA